MLLVANNNYDTIDRVLNARFFWLEIASFYTRRNQKNHSKKNMQWIRLRVTTPLLLKCVLAIANMHAFSISRMFDLLACMSVQLLIVEIEPLILQTNYQPANTQPSATVAPVARYSINSPPHTSTANIDGVAFSFGNSQSLELQTGLYSTIRNRLTTHSKPNLR